MHGSPNDRVTGWTLNGGRYYDAGEGRWTPMDTLDAPLDPSDANRCANAANNPVDFADPTGQMSCGEGIFWSVVGVASLAIQVSALLTVGPVAAGATAAAGEVTATSAIGPTVGFQLGVTSAVCGVVNGVRSC